MVWFEGVPTSEAAVVGTASTLLQLPSAALTGPNHNELLSMPLLRTA